MDRGEGEGEKGRGKERRRGGRVRRTERRLAGR